MSHSPLRLDSQSVAVYLERPQWASLFRTDAGMTEQEWLECTDPDRMLEFLRGRASERKLRLFAAACCRRIWHLMTDERSRRGVQTAELVADGRATEVELQAVCGAAHEAYMEAKGAGPFRWDAPAAPAASVAYAAYSASGGDTAGHAASCAAESLAYQTGAFNDARWTVTFQAERAVQCDLLRELFGMPFSPIALPPSWLTWKDGEVLKQAQIIYEEGRWDRLPRLADTLVAAGCNDQAMLTHCQQAGEHVPGCWVADVLLGKEPAIKTGLASRQSWLACSDPMPMLEFLQNKASDRKWRLFAVACCRHIWHLLTDGRSRDAVAVAEQYADGLATEAELGLARIAAEEAEREAKTAEWYAEAEANFCYTAEYCKLSAALYGTYAVRAAVAPRASEPGGDGRGSWYWSCAALAQQARSEALASLPAQTNENGDDVGQIAHDAAQALEAFRQADAIRDIFGHLLGPLTETSVWLTWGHGTVRWALAPSNRTSCINPAWLAWNNGTVLRISQAIYEESAFDRLPILADALEDAGCTEADILGHCRQQNFHVRGCWIVDLLRGKD